jgi:hypothetical protein
MLRAVAFVSLVYDVTIGVALLAAAPRLAAWFGVPPPSPPVFADTNGLFLVVVGLGYLLPLRDPVRHRAYLWLMGPVLKGGGLVIFLRDAIVRYSPASFLLFAVGDGLLALWTLVALLNHRPPRPVPAEPGPA